MTADSESARPLYLNRASAPGKRSDGRTAARTFSCTELKPHPKEAIAPTLDVLATVGNGLPGSEMDSAVKKLLLSHNFK